MTLLFRKYKTYPIIYNMPKHKCENPETIDELVAELESPNQTIKNEKVILLMTKNRKLRMITRTRLTTISDRLITIKREMSSDWSKIVNYISLWFTLERKVKGLLTSYISTKYERKRMLKPMNSWQTFSLVNLRAGNHLRRRNNN